MIIIINNNNNLAHIQLENVQKVRFCQKAPVVDRLIT